MLHDPLTPQAHSPAGNVADLRALVWSIGHLAARPPRSSTARPAVQVTDPEPRPVEADPAKAVCYIDGCQAGRVLTYRQHRPVTLWWTAAAALTPGCPGRAVALEETLALSCSFLDAEWAESLDGGVEVRPVDAAYPWEVQAATANLIDEQRRSSERAICAAVPVSDGVVLVDGDLRNKTTRTDLVSCAKSFEGVLFWDEQRNVFDLPAGWRSPILRLPPGRQVDGDRWTAYVRLFDASNQDWSFGLIRIETRDPALIDSVAALCLANRQPLGACSRENQLASIEAVEAYLRARRPHLLTM